MKKKDPRTEKELIKNYHSKLKEYIRSCRDLGNYYHEGVTKLLKEGKKKEAMKFLKKCPDRLTLIGLTNLIKFKED